MTIIRPEKHAAIYYSTVPFCSHLVQNPVAEVFVQIDVEAMLNLSEFAVNKINARTQNNETLFIVFNKLISYKANQFHIQILLENDI